MVVMLVLCGCGRGPCAERRGTYQWDLTARTGDCGDMRESIITISSEPTAVSAPCTGTIMYAQNNCQVIHDEQCPVAADGGSDEGTFSVHAVIDWSADGTAASGLFEYELDTPDTSNSCQGTYDATYKKL